MTAPAPRCQPIIERHPGPYSGPDAELARAIAMAVIPWYGNDDGATHQRIMQNGVWNDHIAVQAALAAIHNMHKQVAAADARGKRLEEAISNARLDTKKLARELQQGLPKRNAAERLEAISAALSQTEEGR